MVEAATRAAIGATARRFAERITGNRVSYTPESLNRLIDTLVSSELAGRFRELANAHHDAAEAVGYGTDKSAWHLHEALNLDVLANRELIASVRGEVR